mmetsp:Transcript_9591/g.17984  ORF Transcript_9591/g.17984 Transcript_9591/m.17984 type:complete len:241 (+) Transcript_9591:772-1494(+)
MGSHECPCAKCTSCLKRHLAHVRQCNISPGQLRRFSGNACCHHAGHEDSGRAPGGVFAAGDWVRGGELGRRGVPAPNLPRPAREESHRPARGGSRKGEVQPARRSTGFDCSLQARVPVPHSGVVIRRCVYANRTGRGHQRVRSAEVHGRAGHDSAGLRGGDVHMQHCRSCRYKCQWGAACKNRCKGIRSEHAERASIGVYGFDHPINNAHPSQYDNVSASASSSRDINGCPEFNLDRVGF